ncbi:unnamed protein product [Merluccius merluccius]
MEEGSLALLSLSSSSFTSIAETDPPSGGHSIGPPRSQESEHTLKPGAKDVCDGGERMVSAKENFSLNTESMSVTSSDQEKLLLLNKNTELRRVNQELMKLNEEWDRVYRNATVGLQQRVESLVQENNAAKQLNNRLLRKVEHQQSARDYYEQILLQELQKNQDLQDYISQLEGRRDQKRADTAFTADKQLVSLFSLFCLSLCGFPPPISSSVSSAFPSSSSASCSSAFVRPEAGPPRSWTVQDLKEQLEALRCQTQIYESEFQTEHADHKNTLQENRRLRRKREEMRQQVALLQEQLKVYEDDFRKERSDKQVLQRLLVKRNSPAAAAAKDPVLVHRCNNETSPPGGDKRTQSGEGAHSHRHHLHCPNHCNSDGR